MEPVPELIKIMIPGDLHLTEPDLPNHRIANWVVDEANTFVSPDFVQFIGDNVQDATREQFDLFQQLTNRLRSRWFALVGDHDRHRDPHATEFQSRFGKSWGSHRVGGFRFLRLNTQEALPIGLSSEQLSWMRSELNAAAEAGERVVIFQHNYAYQIWEDFFGPGIDEWRSLIQSVRIEALFAGHTHYLQVANDGRNVHIATRSIGDPEGGPAGYLLAILWGPHLGITYRTPEDEGPIVVILAPRQRLLCTEPHHTVSQNGKVNAHIITRSPLVEVVAQIDNGRVFRLEAGPNQLWEANFDLSSLRKGTHQLIVYAVDVNGASGEQVIEFVVDQTGRFTAVPATFPQVHSTNFC